MPVDDVTYALTHVHGEKESIVAALPVEIAYAMESVLRDRYPNRIIRYNPWTRLHMVLLKGGILLCFPVLMDGQHAEAPLIRPLDAEEGNVFARMLSLPVEPITGIALSDDKAISSILRGRSAAVEAAMRTIEVEDLPSTRETIYIDTSSHGWVGISGNMMLGVWLRRRGTDWDIVTPLGTGATFPTADRFESYKRNLSTILV